MKRLAFTCVLLLFAAISLHAQELSQKGRMLTAHKWRSGRTLNNGREVTGKGEAIIYQFRPDGSSLASSSRGEAKGSWKLEQNDSVLVQDKAVRWDILELNNEVLHVRQAVKGFSVEIWYDPVKE